MTLTTKGEKSVKSYCFCWRFMGLKHAFHSNIIFSPFSAVSFRCISSAVYNEQLSQLSIQCIYWYTAFPSHSFSSRVYLKKFGQMVTLYCIMRLNPILGCWKYTNRSQKIGISMHDFEIKVWFLLKYKKRIVVHWLEFNISDHRINVLQNSMPSPPKRKLKNVQ